MSDDGGPAYPQPEQAHPQNSGVFEGIRGMSLREYYAGEIAGNAEVFAEVSRATSDGPSPMDPEVGIKVFASMVHVLAQALANEALKRRKPDNTKRLAEGAEAMEGDPLYAEGGDEVNDGRNGNT